MTSRHASIRRWIISGTVATAVVTSIGATYAYKTVFAHPGEAALKLIPADTQMLGSLDLTPYPSQAIEFKHLDDALDRNGMSQYLDKSLLDIFDPGCPAMEELRPLVQRGLTGAILKGEKAEDTGFVVLLAVSDPAKVNEILASKGRPEFWRGTRYYRIPKAKLSYMVVDNMLMISDKPWAFNKVARVSKGEAPSITSNQAFQVARARAIDSPNLLIFLDPSAISKDLKLPAKFDADFMTISASIQEGGLALNLDGKYDLDKNEFVKIFSGITPVRADLYDKLPSGAYGMIALAQPSAYFRGFTTMMKDQKEVVGSIKDMEDGIQKETGMSIKDDILPSFEGNTVLAAYPSSGDSPAGADVLLMIDDSNSATPNAGVQKLVQYINQGAAKANPPKTIWKSKLNIEGADAYRLSDDVQADMRKSLPHDEDVLKSSTLFGNKTIAWATVGNTVLAASSEDLLAKAVASYSSKGTKLSNDPSFGSDLLAGQSMLAFDLSRISRGVTNTMNLEKMQPEDAKIFRQATGMFENLKQSLSMSGKVNADGSYHTHTFIPLDVDRMLDFVGSQTKQTKR